MDGEIPPLERDTTLTGALYAGRFDVVDRLGEGGMGTVYRARYLQTGEWVALKRLHPEHAGDAEVVARFNREMDATSRIDSEHTARVIEYGAEEGYLYLAMEIIDGRSLDDVIVDDCPMEEARVAHIGRQIADALAAAHALQFVHRDLKPENISLIDRGGDPDFVKVLDFGLAGFFEEAEDARLTGHGLRVGTPLYMAPEYIEGRVNDPRSDLYALGVVLFMLVAGRAPFLGSPYVILQKAVTEGPPPPSTVRPGGCSPWIDELIVRLLQKDPVNRVQTAAELARILRAHEPGAAPLVPTGHEDTLATAPAAPPRRPPAPQRSTRRTLAFVAGVVMLVGASLLSAGGLAVLLLR